MNIDASSASSERTRLLLGVLARFGVLLVAWTSAWALTPRVVPHLTGWSSLGWWTVMKGLVWFGLGAALFRPGDRHAWFGRYGGGIALVLLLGVGWMGLDTATVHLGMKPAPGALQPGPALINGLLFAPMLEEVLFRGLLWTALEDTGTPRPLVWLLSALTFAALHLPGWIASEGASPALLARFALVFAAGLLCGIGRWLTGGVWPAVLLHLINNAASVGLFHG